jgi:pSer/pThr/pTyr-binding forkhead associated (FHA) protein
MAELVFGDRRVDVAHELVLGREGDVQLEDEEVSRRHARVWPSGDGVEIEDLGSRNGTFVNDRRITSATRLTAEDEVRIGHTRIRVEAARVQVTVVSSSDKVSQAPFAPPQAARPRRAPGSRLLLPQLVAYAMVIATAVALLLYFGLR